VGLKISSDQSPNNGENKKKTANRGLFNPEGRAKTREMTAQAEGDQEGAHRIVVLVKKTQPKQNRREHREKGVYSEKTDHVATDSGKGVSMKKGGSDFPPRKEASEYGGGRPCKTVQSTDRTRAFANTKSQSSKVENRTLTTLGRKFPRVSGSNFPNLLLRRATKTSETNENLEKNISPRNDQDKKGQACAYRSAHGARARGRNRFRNNQRGRKQRMGKKGKIQEQTNSKRGQKMERSSEVDRTLGTTGGKPKSGVRSRPGRGWPRMIDQRLQLSEVWTILLG